MKLVALVFSWNFAIMPLTYCAHSELGVGPKCKAGARQCEAGSHKFSTENYE